MAHLGGAGLQICTIIAKNYLAQARVLAESFSRRHPEGKVSVLIVDEFDGYIDPDAEEFEVLGIDQIGLDNYERMAATYDVTELSTAVKPWLLRHLLDRDGCDAVTYLDPDIWVLDDIVEVDRLARDAGLVLTPHFTAPIPRDGLKPAEEDILIAGSYNLGYISIRSGGESREFLDWWSDRLREDCVVDPAGGHFVDQRWIDLVPGIWQGFHVLRDPGYNLAYWNLPSRNLKLQGDRYTVDGQPLRFFHFSGFDPLNPGELSRHQNRVEIGQSPALARICTAYADAVKSAGYDEARAWPYSWGTLPGGFELDTCSRRLYRRASDEGRVSRSPFSRKGAEQLVRYLAEPDDDNGAATGIPRYLVELHDVREDLRAAFPDLRGGDGARFVDWARNTAELRDVIPALGSNGGGGHATTGNGSGPAGDVHAPPGVGINVAGYFSSEMGVGEAGRQVAGAIEAAGVDTVRIEVPVDAGEMTARLAVLADDQTPHGVNLICVNADMLPAFATAAGERFFESRHSIGMWFWEIEHFPDRWHPAFEPLDEVWVASSHIAGAIQPHSPIPVRTIRLPVTPVPPDASARSELGMPDGFCFLFVFDYRSVLKRKNPIGLLEAFDDAFGARPDVSLVIKTVGSEGHPEEAASLAQAARGRDNVHLVEREMSLAAKNAMIAGCDCYVSLHRSEGFGLTLAEAMYFGKPVIATGYSGNLDFMTEENSYLVGHEMTRVGEGALPYPADAKWAEPDPEHAAELMRRVVEDRAEAEERGRRAEADLRERHSYGAAGSLIRSRLEGIRVSPPAAPEAGSPVENGNGAAPAANALVPLSPRGTSRPGAGAGIVQLRHLLEFNEPPARPNAGRLRQSVKQAYMRLLRPYVAYQRRINQSALQALDEVQVDLTRRQASAVEETRQEIERIEALARELDELLRVDLEGIVWAELARRDHRFDELERQFWQALTERRDELHAEHRELLETLERRSQALQDALAQDVAAIRERTDEGLARLDSQVVALDAQLTAEMGEVRARLEGPEDLVDASRTSPFMADDRFAKLTDPSHGTVLGFSAGNAANGSGDYRSFEDVFRGSEQMIRDRQRVYLDAVADFAPVLDIGCGRGEFLDLLEEAGIEHRGVDLDAGMAARCREKGHADVAQADALEYLSSLPEHQTGAIFSAQVIEHLEYDALMQLLHRGLKVLRPGGLLIAETVNPHSARALKTFWVDPTHRAPLFPETMLALCQLTGYASAHVFCPNGEGDWERDRIREGEYAIVARSPATDTRD